jgi:phosphoribosylformylglycinamidine synthase
VALRRVPGSGRTGRDDFVLFSESNTRFVCEVMPAHRAGFERLLRGLPFGLVGRTQERQRLVVTGRAGNEVADVDLVEAANTWRTALTRRL